MPVRQGLLVCALVSVLTGASSAKGPAPSAPRSLPAVVPGDAKAILGDIQRPGATAVLVNVWATWCDACREEMPRLVRFFREHRQQGLRLILISADDEAEREHAAQFLADQGVDVPSWLKRGDDMAFIDALDKRWTGTLPASLLFDGKGHVRELWQGPVTAPELERAWARVSASGARPPSPPEHPATPRRKP
jgi:thiol-disulfide isomerase/thioredoxin